MPSPGPSKGETAGGARGGGPSPGLSGFPRLFSGGGAGRCLPLPARLEELSFPLLLEI